MVIELGAMKYLLISGYWFGNVKDIRLAKIGIRFSLVLTPQTYEGD